MEGHCGAKGGNRSMTNPITKSPLNPRLTDVLSALKTDIFRSLNAVKVGEIVTFDMERKTAKIKILFKRVLPDKTVSSYPALVDCPVFTLQGGGASIQFPIVAGDQCLLLFSDRNLDAWFTAGSEQAPLTARCHDLSDGIALVGLNSLASTLANYEADKVRLFFEDGKATLILEDGSATLQAEDEAAAVIADAAGARLTGGTDEAVVQAATLVKIENATANLLTLIEGLIDVLKALQVEGPISLTAASISALEAQKLIFEGLLE
jgi:hypothetical protein